MSTQPTKAPRATDKLIAALRESGRDAMSRDGHEYRVGAKDAGESKPDYSEPYATLAEAERDRDRTFVAADPPFDEVWIERRPLAGWERLP
jgi:hypothetical protein